MQRIASSATLGPARLRGKCHPVNPKSRFGNAFEHVEHRFRKGNTLPLGADQLALRSTPLRRVQHPVERLRQRRHLRLLLGRRGDGRPQADLVFHREGASGLHGDSSQALDGQLLIAALTTTGPSPVMTGSSARDSLVIAGLRFEARLCRTLR